MSNFWPKKRPLNFVSDRDRDRLLERFETVFEKENGYFQSCRLWEIVAYEKWSVVESLLYRYLDAGDLLLTSVETFSLATILNTEEALGTRL